MSGDAMPSEFDLIARHLRPLAANIAGSMNLADDAAILAPADRHAELIVTTDTLVEGIHFLAGTPPNRIAQKLLRVNLSDLAAMAATPHAYNLSLALNHQIDDVWLQRFAAGLAAEQDQWRIALLGGDTVRTDGPLVLTVSMFGWADNGPLLTRAGAVEGDEIFVSGVLGDAELGLRLLSGPLDCDDPADRAYLIDRHYAPTPRLGLGSKLADVAHAGLDVSDGLLADLQHLCDAASPRLGAVVELAQVPISDAASRMLQQSDVGLRAADLMSCGDDYELLFVCAPNKAEAVGRLSHEMGLSITRIGHLVSAPGVRLRNTAGQDVAIERAGYRHF